MRNLNALLSISSCSQFNFDGSLEGNVPQSMAANIVSVQKECYLKENDTVPQTASVAHTMWLKSKSQAY